MTNEEYLTRLRLVNDEFNRAVQLGYALAQRGEQLPESVTQSVFRVSNEELGRMDDRRVQLLST